MRWGKRKEETKEEWKWEEGRRRGKREEADQIFNAFQQIVEGDEWTLCFNV